MSVETQIHTAERSETELFNELLKLEPKPIELFVPIDGPEQRDKFLAGETDSPSHTYHKLEMINLDERLEQLQALATEIRQSKMDEKVKDVYHLYVKRFIAATNYLQLVQNFHRAEPQNKVGILNQIGNLNRELWGETDEPTYRSLIAEGEDKIKSKQINGDDAEILRQEFISMLPAHEGAIDRFIPSDQTFQSVQQLVNELYGKMFNHIPPNTTSFPPDEIIRIFREIINTEFGESAAGWSVELTDSTAINVVAGEKKIKIPVSRGNLDLPTLRGMIAHEIGVHMLRSIMGESTNIQPLRTGLPGYYDSEEGLGRVMEQGAKGVYEDSGIPYYLITGMAQHDTMTFRNIFEIMWRYECLTSVAEHGVIDDDARQDAKQSAYKKMIRIFRGTDTIAWSKDLAYYNGTEKMWRYMEENESDAVAVTLAMLGKADITDIAHRSVLLDTKSI
jgi:hypothetical protein